MIAAATEWKLPADPGEKLGEALLPERPEGLGVKSAGVLHEVERELRRRRRAFLFALCDGSSRSDVLP